MIAQTCARLWRDTGVGKVCLSGGTFQNTTLLSLAVPLLAAAGLEVFTQRIVPANDGGLSLGQAAVAAYSRLLKSL